MPSSRPPSLPDNSYPQVGSYAIPETDILYGQFASVDNTAIVVRFTLEDLNNIKALLIANSPSTSWIAIDQCALTDQNDRPVIALTNGVNTKGVTNYTEDRTAPSLQAFDLDMDTGLLSFLFSETISLATLMPTYFTLQSVLNASTPAVESYTLNYTLMLTGGYSPAVTLPIHTLDLNQIKARRSLATAVADTYISITRMAIEDTEGNKVINISPYSALQVTNYTQDTTRPKLVSFDLDMDEGLLSLTFDETVSATTFNPTRLVLLSDIFFPTTSFRLRGGYSSTLDSTVITFNLTADDLNEIKRDRDLAIVRYSTILNFDSLLVNDTNNNPVQPDTFPVTTFIPDTTPPQLLNFMVNLTSETLHWTFSETIDSLTFDSTQITLQNSSPFMRRILLTASSFLILPEDSTQLVLSIESPALNYLKMYRDIFTSLNNTFISITSGLVHDMNGNPIVAIPNGIQTSSFYGDFVRPELNFFSLDLTKEVLTLTFTETVDYTTAYLSGITLQHRRDHVGSSVEDWTLTGGVISPIYSSILTVQLSINDLNNIKRIVELATSISSTYLRLTWLFIRDMNNNSIVPIPESEGLLVTQFIGDTIPPYLVSFSVDLSLELVNLTFSETVSQPSFQVRYLTLQAYQTSDIYYVTLTSYASISVANSTFLTFYFDHSDLNVLKAVTQVATSMNNTFLSHTSSLITDMSGNMIVPVLPTLAEQAESFITDRVQPRLISYIFDLDSGCMTLSFSETLNAAPTNFTSIVLQSSPDLTLAYQMGIPVTTLRLTGGNVTYIPLNLPRVIFSSEYSRSDTLSTCLNSRDLNLIKYDTNICHDNSSNNCFLTFGAAAFVDSAGNHIVPISTNQGSPPIMFHNDVQSPRLVEFSMMDMDLGQLVLMFDEPLNPTTQLNLPPNRARLQRFYRNIDIQDSFESLVLSGGTLSLSQTGLVVTINMTTANLNTLKLNDMLCTDNFDCWISLLYWTFFDPQLNGNLEVSIDNGLDARTFVNDTTAPQLLTFDLDIDSGILSLHFDEPVRALSFYSPSVYLFNAQVNYTSVYTLTSESRPNASNDLTLHIQLSDNDITSIKNISNLATRENNTFLRLLTGTVSDMNGNPIRITPVRLVNLFQEDSTSPRLTEFSLNLITDTLSFTFSEIVRSSSFNLNAFSILSGPLQFGIDLSLRSSTGTDGAFVVYAALSQADIMQLKFNFSIATTRVNTYLAVSADAIVDMQGNYLQPLLTSDPLMVSSIISDTKATSLLSFTFNLNTGVLSLTFDDVVVASSLRPSSLVLQDQSTRSTSYRLSDSSYTVSPDGYMIDIVLILLDLNAVKANTALATNINNTYVTIEADLLRDANWLDLVPITDDNGVRASIFYTDRTQPQLTGFNFDLDSGNLTLSFSETVQGQSLSVSGITLHSSRDISSTNYTLRPSSLSYSQNTAEVVVTLSASDLDRIKLLPNLFTDLSNSYLSIANNTILDMSNVPSVSTPHSISFGANLLILDTTRPTLLAYDIDLNTGILKLTFSEAMNMSSLVASGLTIQNSEDSIFPRVTLLNDVTPVLFGGLGRVLHFRIHVDNLNSIKYYSDLATSGANTFLITYPATISDMSQNQVEGIFNPFALKVSNFTSDTTAPRLSNFSLNLNLSTPELILTFDETIDSSSLDVSQITLLSMGESCNNSQPNGTCMYPASHLLSPGSQPLYTLTESDNSTVITVLIGELDANRIKFLSELAVSQSSTRISLTPYAISDMNQNQVYPILRSSPTVAYKFYPDELPSILREFSLNMDLPLLSLTFDETVNINSIQPPLIVVQHLGLSLITHLLASSSLTNGQVNSTIVSVSISFDDFNSITANPSLATSLTNSYLRLLEGTIADMNGNLIQVILNGNALPASEFIPDVSRPFLSSFDLDMDSLQLTLTFSETVNASSLDTTMVTLRQTIYYSGQTFTLTKGSTTNTVFSFVVIIQIGRADANEIKRFNQLAQSSNSTFLSFTYFTILDMNQNPVIPINNVSVTQYTPDTTLPIPLVFIFDLTQETISLSFDETVRASSIDASKVTIQSSDNISSLSLQQYALRQSLTPLTNDSTLFIAKIDLEDLHMIKLNLELATNVNNTFLAFQYGAILDMALTPNSIIAGTIIQSFSVVPDITRPNLIDFMVDMNSGTLTLYFDEPVNVTSIYIPGLTVQNAARSRTGLQLSESSVLTPSNGLEFMIRFSPAELDEIKRIDSLYTTMYTSYVSISSQFLTDLSRNLIVPLENGFALGASRLYPDMGRPSILTYNLDMDNGSLTLSFSETVNISSFRCSDIYLSEKRFCNNSYQLTGCVIDTANAVYDSQDIGNTGDAPGGFGNATKWNTTFFYSTFLKFYITLYDLNNLKALGIAADISSVYLNFKQSTILDQSDLYVLEMNCSYPGLTPSGGFTPDTTRPTLQSFNFSLDSGLLTFSFSETVDGSRLAENYLTFVSGQNNMTSSFQYYTLTLVTHSDDPVPILNASVSIDDLNEIKRRRDLATGIENTFVSITSSFITDTLGRAVNPIPISNALQVESFIPDRTRPILLYYDLEMDTGTFHFTFDETVNASSLDPAQIWIQNVRYANTTFGLASYRVISGNQSLSDNTVISLTLSANDLNSIKNMTTIATSRTNTFIFFSSAFISDMNYNTVESILSNNSKQVLMFTPDDTEPVLTEFAVNLTTEILSLTFSEIVNFSSFNPSLLSFHPSVAPSPGYMLSGGKIITYYNSLVIDFRLLISDLNSIKLDTSLFTEMNDSFITFVQYLILDLNRNYVVLENAGKQASEFYGDFVRPQLVNFILDLNSEMLTLTFDESVNAFSINVSQITIQSQRNLGNSWTLRGGVYPLYSSLNQNLNSTVVTVRIGWLDLNAIKLITTLAVSNQSTYLSHSSNLIRDMNSNYVQPTLNTDSLRTINFYPDLTAPNMSYFDLDLNDNFFTFEFDEVMNASSLNCEALTLSNTDSLSSLQIKIFNCSTRLVNDYVLYVDLGVEILNEIKFHLNLATSSANTFISFPPDLVTDMNNNYITEISITQALMARNFSQDLTAPYLLSFDFDLDAGNLLLSFSETILALSVNPTSLIISSSRYISNGSSYYQLTAGVIQTRDSHIISINISLSDLNQIKLMRNLATNLLNTNIFFDNSFARDMNMNPIIPISNSSAQMTSNFTNDTTPPDIIAILLDLDNALLTLYFTETVDVNTLQINNMNVLFFNSSSSTLLPPQYSLVNSSSNSTDNPVITLMLSRQDVNQLNYIRTVAYSLDTSFLFLPAIIRDMSGNVVTPLYEGRNETRPVTNYINDTTHPEIVNFELDMNTGLLDVTFTETIFKLSPFKRYFKLSNGVNNAVNQSYNLLTTFDVSGPSLDGPGHPPTITIHISTRDLNEIKALRYLATLPNNTFLSATPEAAFDIFGNNLTEISINMPLPVLSYFPDQTSPQLLNFTFDLNSGLIALTFDETIDAPSTLYTSFSFLNSDQPSINYSLQFPADSQISTDGTTQLYVKLSNGELNEVKVLSDLFTQTSNAFLLLTANSIRDPFSNQLNISNLPLMASQFDPDLTNPNLTSFNLDMNTNTLTLYFSESVNVSTLNISRISLQSYYTVNQTGETKYTLQHGLSAPEGTTTVSVNGPYIVLNLGSIDTNEIKKRTLVATRRGNTFITLKSTALSDMSGLPILAIMNGVAQQVNVYVKDSSQPVLTQFDFDFDVGILSLTFDETIDISSFIPTKVTFSTSVETYTLQLGTLSDVTDDSTKFNFTLEKFDFDNLKALSSLFTNNTNTSFTLAVGAVTDLSDDRLLSEPAQLQMISFIPDTTSPKLTS